MKISTNRYAIKLLENLIGRFKWFNLPSNIDSNTFEKNLICGADLINYDELTNKIYTFYPSVIDWDINGVPDNLRGNTVMNGQTFYFKNNDDCVLLPNCFLDNIYYIVGDINQTANVLTQIDNNIRKNLKQLAMPVLAKGNKDNQKSLKEILKKVLDSDTVEMIVDESFNADNIKVLDIHAEYLLDKYFYTKINIINNFYTRYGIASVAEKPANLTNHEVDSSLGGMYAARYSEINARQYICNFLNNKYNLNISFKFCDGAEDDLKPEKEVSEKWLNIR